MFLCGVGVGVSNTGTNSGAKVVIKHAGHAGGVLLCTRATMASGRPPSPHVTYDVSWARGPFPKILPGMGLILGSHQITPWG